jgi:signal transduction histidine kinase/ActR/RegA family two-component response regulator
MCFWDLIWSGRLTPPGEPMMTSPADPHDEIEALRARLAETEEMLRAIQHAEVDAVVVEGAGGHQVYTLQSAEEPYRRLVEEMQEGAVVITDRGDVLYANARFSALVGEPMESIVGGSIARFVNASDRSEFDSLLDAGSGRRRSRLVGSPSGTFEVSLSLTTTLSAGGHQLNLIVTDLSDLLAATSSRDRAQHDNRAKDEFMAMVAHEFRNPLGAISNAVRVLELTQLEGEHAIAARQVIARQVGHLSQLMSDLLDVERVVSGKIRLNRQPLNLVEAVHRAVATITSDVGLNRTIDVRTEPVWVDGDPIRVEQVLTNIVTNAVKYTPSGGRIRVELRADGDDAVLDVEDDGFGISAELMPFIFDLYAQSERTLDRARGGMGIGLTLVRRLVELHGGTIVASSEGEGRGSTFTVRLRRIPSPRTSRDFTVLSERRSRTRRVLLIEDNGDAREMLRRVLELAGHVVYDAADGVRGLELLNVARPDVGIIDIGLPRMDGYQVAKKIREDPHGRGMLLLAVTGEGTPDAGRWPSEQGFDHHLVKPVDHDHLIGLLSGVAEVLQQTSS